jgi:hypothetical protein
MISANTGRYLVTTDPIYLHPGTGPQGYPESYKYAGVTVYTKPIGTYSTQGMTDSQIHEPTIIEQGAVFLGLSRAGYRRLAPPYGSVRDMFGTSTTNLDLLYSDYEIFDAFYLRDEHLFVYVDHIHAFADITTSFDFDNVFKLRDTYLSFQQFPYGSCMSAAFPSQPFH